MRKILILAGCAGLLASVTSPAISAPITNPNDPRIFQGATVGTFAQLLFGANTLANRQLVVDTAGGGANSILDDGIFSSAGFVTGTLVSTNWSQGISSGTPFAGVAGGAHLGGNCAGRSFDSTGTGSFAFACGVPGSGGNPALTAAANGIDDLWFQSSNALGDTVFDLGFNATKAAVFNTIDHGPLPQEAIESTVFLSNDQVTWTQAVVERVWLEGFKANLGIKWDGFVYAVGTGTSQTFRFASVIHGGPGALVNDGDDEINGVMGLQGNFGGVPSDVPEPASMALFGFGLAGLGFMRRRRKAVA